MDENPASGSGQVNRPGDGGCSAEATQLVPPSLSRTISSTSEGAPSLAFAQIDSRSAKYSKRAQAQIRSARKRELRAERKDTAERHVHRESTTHGQGPSGSLKKPSQVCQKIDQAAEIEDELEHIRQMAEKDEFEDYDWQAVHTSQSPDSTLSTDALELDEAEELAHLAQMHAKSLVGTDGQLIMDDLMSLQKGTSFQSDYFTKLVLSHLPYHLLIGLVNMGSRGSEHGQTSEYAAKDSNAISSLVSGDVINSSLMASDQRERVFWLCREAPDAARPTNRSAPPSALEQPVDTAQIPCRAVKLFCGYGKLVAPHLLLQCQLDAEEEAHPRISGSFHAKQELNGHESVIVGSWTSFDRKLSAFTHGIIDGVLGQGVILGGSAVLACLLRADFASEYALTLYILLTRVFMESFCYRRHAVEPAIVKIVDFATGQPPNKTLKDRFDDIHSPYFAADLDISIFAASCTEAAARLASVAQRVIRKMQTHGPCEVVRTPNGLTVCGQWPLRNVQLVTYIFESVDEFLSFADLDCTAVAFDGRDVWAAPRAFRAFSKGYNFVPSKMLVHRRGAVHRVAKYAGRGFGSLVFQLCKHQPRCDVCIDRETSDAVASAENLVKKAPALEQETIDHFLKSLSEKDSAGIAKSMLRMRQAGISLLPRGPGVDASVVEAYIDELPFLTNAGLLRSPPLSLVSIDTTSASLSQQLFAFVAWFRTAGCNWKDWGMVPPGPHGHCGAPLHLMSEAAGLAITPSDPLDVSLTKLIRSWARLPDEDVQVRRCLAELQSSIRTILLGDPEWKFELSGSSANGFGCCNVDVDVVMYNSRFAENSEHVAKETLSLLAQLMEVSRDWAVVKKVFRAKVPLLKLLYEDRIEVDLTVNNIQPLLETNCLFAYASLDDRISQLGLLVKLWGKSRNVCGAPRGHISSYSLTMMVIYFLQVVENLPSLQEAEDDNLAYLDWQFVQAKAAAVRIHWKLDKPLAVLFCGFFAFYARDFKWGSEVVSMRLGRRKKACNAAFVRLPGRSMHRLHIEDAFQVDRNNNDVLLPGNERKLKAAIQTGDARLQKGLSLRIPLASAPTANEFTEASDPVSKAVQV